MPSPAVSPAVRPRSRGFVHLGVARAIVVGTPVLVLLIALVVGVGWIGGWRPAVTFGSGGATMKANTALALGACAIALLGIARGGRRVAGWSGGMALLSVAIGAVTLLQYGTGLEPGVDQLLVDDRWALADGHAPGRPAPQTAVALILLGAGIAAQIRRGRVAAAGRWAVLPAIAIAAISLFEHASGIEQLFAVPGVTETAAHSGLALLVLGIAVILLDPTTTPAAALLATGVRGTMLRRLMPAMLLIPFVVGVLRVVGQRHGFYGTGTGVLILVAATTVLGVAVVWMASVTLGRIERERDEALRQAVAGEARTRALVEGAPVGIVETDAAGAGRHVNARWARMAGRDSADWLTAVHPRDREWVEALWARAMRTGEGLHTRLRLRAPDGRVTWVDFTGSPVRRDEDALTGWIGTAHDVTSEVHEELELAARERIARAVADDAEAGEVFAIVAQEAARVLGAEASGVLRLDGDAAVLVGFWAAPGLTVVPLGTVVPMDDDSTASARAIASGGTVRVEYGRDGTRAPLAAPSGRRFRSGVSAVVRVGGEVWGVVSIAATEQGELPADSDRRLGHFADLVGLAASTADAREKLRAMASSDHLTGLPNARSFHARLIEEVERARRHDRPLSLVILDIDHFKRVNDTYGHPVGDAVLSEVASRMGRATRVGELVARVGGEEFAWILPDTDGLAAFAAAERLRGTIADAPIHPVGRITVSAGVCELSESGSSSELYRLADLALYWAKTNGRDATFRYSEEVFELLSADEQASRMARATALGGIRVLAQAVDAKDPSTQRHSERVADIAVRIAQELGWADDRIGLLREAALVHDVGKIGVPDAVLLKPGRLDEAEWEQVRAHSALGAQIVADALAPEQVEWVRHHHEREDGVGYPDRVSGAAFTQGARILAVADAWDAMTAARAYRAPLSHHAAMDEVRNEAGHQFCPDVVAALTRLWDRGEVVAGATSVS